MTLQERLLAYINDLRKERDANLVHRGDVACELQELLGKHEEEYKNCPYAVQKNGDGTWNVKVDVAKLQEGVPNFSFSKEGYLTLIDEISEPLLGGNDEKP